MPSFYQPAHSVRQVAVNIGVDRVNLLQADAANLLRDASLNDRVEFRIFGDVGAKIRILGITSPGVQVSIILSPWFFFFLLLLSYITCTDAVLLFMLGQ